MPTTTTARPDNDMWRVDVFGAPIAVRGEVARRLVEKLVQDSARMKMALRKIKSADSADPRTEAIRALEGNGP